MLEGEKMGFKERFKGRKVSEQLFRILTRSLRWGKRAEGATWLKKWERLEAEGLRVTKEETQCIWGKCYEVPKGEDLEIHVIQEYMEKLM